MGRACPEGLKGRLVDLFTFGGSLWILLFLDLGLIDFDSPFLKTSPFLHTCEVTCLPFCVVSCCYDVDT